MNKLTLIFMTSMALTLVGCVQEQAEQSEEAVTDAEPSALGQMSDGHRLFTFTGQPPGEPGLLMSLVSHSALFRYLIRIVRPLLRRGDSRVVPPGGVTADLFCEPATDRLRTAPSYSHTPATSRQTSPRGAPAAAA